MSRPFRLALFCAVVLGLPGGAIAADAPTKDEWAPVVQAIADQAPDAGTQLAAITDKYPKWAGGWIERARHDLSANQPEDAWKHSRKALAIEGTNGEAAALAVQALTKVGRNEDAMQVADQFRLNRHFDKQSGGRAGWVNFYAGQAALTAKTPDLAKAEEYLKVAKACAGATVPGQFHSLDARLMIRRGDLAGAAKSLERAVAGDPQLWDAWYELGRVRSALAEAETTTPGKRALLVAAEQAFTAVTKALPDDYESWLGLGRAQAGQAKLEIDDGGAGGAKLRDAAASFSEALERKPDLVPALSALGEAQLRLERFPLAIESLTKARELGANDKALLYNLAMALEKSGRGEEAAKIHAGTTATTAPELINKAMALSTAKLYRAAIELFEQAAKHPALEPERETRGQVLRFAGHAWRDWAAATEPAPTPDEREQRLASAADAYRRAGDAGDRVAIRHYAALQSGRGGLHGYNAGWTVLGWGHYVSVSGWSLVLGNYGASQVWRSPLHLGVWGVLVGLPLLLWIASLFRRAPAEAPEATRQSTRRVPTEKQPARRDPPPPKPEREMNPLTARVKARQALEPRATPKPPARPAPRPPAAKHVETAPVPKRQPSPAPAPAARKTPLPETDELDPPPAAPARRSRPS